MLQKHTLSPEEVRLFGMGMTAVALTLLAGVAWRWESMCQLKLMRALLGWGRGRWSFSASRLGASGCGSFALILGLMCLDQSRDHHRQIWCVALAGGAAFLIVAAIHDYVRFRRKRG